MIAMTRPAMSVSEPTLYVAFELGKKDWKLAMTSGFGVAAVAAHGGERRLGGGGAGDRRRAGRGSACRPRRGW